MTGYKKIFLLIALFVCSLGILEAQTNSPYSRYGYGVLREQATGPSKGMGGIGYGLQNNLSANPINPASYSSVDTLTMLIDFGVHYNHSTLKDNSGSRADNSGGLDYVTLLFPVTRQLGVSAGLLPYTSVGYDYGTVDDQSGIAFRRSFSGSGGLSLAYIGMGYQTPFEGLFVGTNVSYIFGSIENQRSIPAIDVNGSNTSSDYSKLNTNGVKLDLGFQYKMNVSPRDVLTLGAVYSPQMNLRSDFQNRHYDVTSAGALIKGDTTNVKGVDGAIPHTFGLGFTIKHDRRITYGADVTYQKWNGLKYSPAMGDGLSVSNRFNNRVKLNVGAEYMHSIFDRSVLKRVKWRGGFNYSNSYLNVQAPNGMAEGYNEYGATFGFGIPFYDPHSYGKRTSYVNISFDYKKLKPKVSGLIDEQYLGVSLNVNINDRWFMKRKI